MNKETKRKKETEKDRNREGDTGRSGISRRQDERSLSPREKVRRNSSLWRGRDYVTFPSPRT